MRRWEDWPHDLSPTKVPVASCNRAVLPAPIDRVWRHLIRAEDWPLWYPNSWRVRVVDGPAPDLGPEARFNWITLGLPIRTRVTVFEPPSRLAWYGEAVGARGLHTWILQPAAGCETDVVTEEVQTGVVPSIVRWILRPTLHRVHDLWLERLGRRAASDA
jgi:hypothetical protein